MRKLGKSVVASNDLDEGHVLTADDLKVKVSQILRFLFIKIQLETRRTLFCIFTVYKKATNYTCSDTLVYTIKSIVFLIFS